MDQSSEKMRSVKRVSFKLELTGHEGTPGVFADHVHMSRTEGRVILSFFQHVFPVGTPGEDADSDNVAVLKSALVARVMIEDATAAQLVTIMGNAILEKLDDHEGSDDEH